jgi:hypothetical protein
LLFDGACDVVSDVFPVALDMAEVAVRQIQTFREALQHPALRQMGMPVNEVVKQFSEIFMPDLTIVHRHVEISPDASVCRGAESGMQGSNRSTAIV